MDVNEWLAKLDLFTGNGGSSMFNGVTGDGSGGLAYKSQLGDNSLSFPNQSAGGAGTGAGTSGTDIFGGSSFGGMASGFGDVMSGIGSGINAYTALKGMGLAEDAFEESKFQSDRNYDAQKTIQDNISGDRDAVLAARGLGRRDKRIKDARPIAA